MHPLGPTPGLSSFMVELILVAPYSYRKFTLGTGIYDFSEGPAISYYHHHLFTSYGENNNQMSGIHIKISH